MIDSCDDNQFTKKTRHVYRKNIMRPFEDHTSLVSIVVEYIYGICYTQCNLLCRISSPYACFPQTG